MVGFRRGGRHTRPHARMTTTSRRRTVPGEALGYGYARGSGGGAGAEAVKAGRKGCLAAPPRVRSTCRKAQCGGGGSTGESRSQVLEIGHRNPFNAPDWQETTCEHIDLLEQQGGVLKINRCSKNSWENYASHIPIRKKGK